LRLTAASCRVLLRQRGTARWPSLAHKEEAFPAGSALFDIERGRLDALRLLPWQTDTSVSINSWGYVENDKYRTAASLVATLADVVSKNGNLLLNVGPKADGTIPAEAAKVLDEIGGWLAVNGEAIWRHAAVGDVWEGPTRNAVGSLKEGAIPTYTPADIRFTTRDGRLYALGLAHPADGAVRIGVLYAGNPYAPPIKAVHLLGARRRSPGARRRTACRGAASHRRPGRHALCIAHRICAPEQDLTGRLHTTS
jgi:alpha-L-fucosidase